MDSYFGLIVVVFVAAVTAGPAALGAEQQLFVVAAVAVVGVFVFVVSAIALAACRWLN